MARTRAECQAVVSKGARWVPGRDNGSAGSFMGGVRARGVSDGSAVFGLSSCKDGAAMNSGHVCDRSCWPPTWARAWASPFAA